MSTRVETDARFKGDFCPELDALSRWGPTKPRLADARPTDGREWERAAALMELEDGLEPCPYLGCDPKRLSIEGVWRGKYWQAQCAICGARGPIMETPDKAAKAWNEAANPSARTGNK